MYPTDPEYNRFIPNAPNFRQPSIGQIGQAKQRAAARRGGTPNAPEVNDEPMPAGPTRIAGGPDLTGSSAALRQSFERNSVIPNPGPVTRSVQGTIGGGRQQPGPPRIAAFDPNALTPSEAVGFGVRPGGSLGDEVTAPEAPAASGWEAYEQSAIANSRTPATPAITGATAAAAPAPRPAAPPEPKAPAGYGTSDTENRGFTPAIAAPAEEAGGAGITRSGNSFSGVGKPTDDQGAPYGSDLNPDVYRQQYRAMQEQERADEGQKIAAMRGEANRAQAWQDRQAAENEARVARWRATNGADMVLAPENSGYDEQRRAIVADAIQKTRAEEVAKGNVYATTSDLGRIATARNPIAEGAIQSDSANRALMTQQAVANQREGRPLLKEESRQRIAGMDIANKIGDLQLEGIEREAAMLRDLQNTTDPGEYQKKVSALLQLRGKESGKDRYIQIDIPGPPDAMGNSKPMRGIFDVTTGKIIAGNEAAAPPEQERERAMQLVKAGKMTRDEANARLRAAKIPTI